MPHDRVVHQKIKIGTTSLHARGGVGVLLRNGRGTELARDDQFAVVERRESSTAVPSAQLFVVAVVFVLLVL